MPVVNTPGDPGSTTPVTPTIHLGQLTLGSSFRWLIPTVALTVPGVVIVGAVLLQLLTGLTFIELTRRTVGALARRRRDTSH